MNPQAYELWYENFAAILKFNPRWDSYDRLALELFRMKNIPLKVLASGVTLKTTAWAESQQFTQQLDWMCENEYVMAMSVTKDHIASDYLAKQFKKSQFLVLDPGQTYEPMTDEMPVYGLNQIDLLFVGDDSIDLGDTQVWGKLQKGCLVAIDQSMKSVIPTGCSLIKAGPISIWRKI